MTLANGLRVILQQEAVSDTVQVYGRVKSRASVQTPPGKEGVDEVLDALFDYGTRSLDRVAFRRAVDAIGADVSAGTEFSAQVLADRFDRAVELLADSELRPALPEAAFQVVRKQVAARVAGRLGSPEYRSRRALETALFPPGDPALREATEQSVSALTLEDVREYHRRVFRPDLTTIVVIGNVRAEDARAVIQKHFGEWSAEGPPPATELPAVPANAQAFVNVPNPARVQDSVTLAQTLGINRFDDDYYPLQLGNHVLGGAFYATRLYRDLRERAGLVYFVDSAVQATRTRGLYFVTYACDPANVSRARGIVLEELRAMQSAVVPEVELHQAKALLLRSIPLAEASADQIGFALLGRAVEGLPLDEPTRAAQKYVALTGEEVRAAFARWIRPDGLAQVTEGPAPR
jgi:zinc protease